MSRVIVIGGGPSGMMSAAVSAKNNNQVVLIEQNNKLGKKLYITGKGRCNLTNLCDVETLIENTKSNPYFLYSAFYTFDSIQTIEYFKNIGLKTKVERGNRVYPASEKSSDVIKALEKDLYKNNVEVILNTRVEEILTKNNKIIGVKTNKAVFKADKVILCTGGISYSMTGSTGDGFKFAKNLGHKITDLYPSLVPLKIKENYKNLQGLSLKNVAIEVLVNNNIVYNDFGEMLFTHFGVSGPIILSASRFITKNIGNDIKIKIDLKPALSEKELDMRILRDFKTYLNKDFKNSLSELLPQKLIDAVILLSGILPNKKVNEITKEERKKLVSIIKGFYLTVENTTGFNEAVITCGGISTDEIDPSTMESKIIKGLYFAGEIIDVDAFTGGFNLQIAFSTAYLAGMVV